MDLPAIPDGYFDEGLKRMFDRADVLILQNYEGVKPMAISSSDKGQSEVAFVPETEQGVRIQEPSTGRVGHDPRGVPAQPNPGPTQLNPKPPTTNPPTEPERTNPAPIGQKHDRKTITVVEANGKEHQVEVHPGTTTADVMRAADSPNGKLSRSVGAAPAFGDIDPIFDNVKHGDKIFVTAPAK